jgi:hypothetical protein
MEKYAVARQVPALRLCAQFRAALDAFREEQSIIKGF